MSGAVVGLVVYLLMQVVRLRRARDQARASAAEWRRRFEELSRKTVPIDPTVTTYELMEEVGRRCDVVVGVWGYATGKERPIEGGVEQELRLSRYVQAKHPGQMVTAFERVAEGVQAVLDEYEKKTREERKDEGGEKGGSHDA